MASGRRRSGGAGVTARAARPFTSREITLLGLMAALWGAIEITVGGMVKGWHIPFVGGSLLSTFGVVVLLTARASVPRAWSSLLVGLVAAGIRLATGVGGPSAMFAAIGIATEALIVECVLTFLPARRIARMVAGIVAVLWALVHPFLVQGYLAGLGPAKVYGFTIRPIVGDGAFGSAQVLLVVVFLVLIHVSLGVSAVMFVDRILLAPYARARNRQASDGRGQAVRAKSAGAKQGLGPLLFALVLVSLVSAPAAAQQTDEAATEGAGPATDDAYTLPELTVFGTRLLGPYSVFSLDASDIEETGVEDLAEALELVPGMVVRVDSRGEAKLSSRGLAEREIVVLVDGVPISDPYTGSVNAATVLSGALGGVRVIKGPAASVYGANALAGIVEVTTLTHDRPGLAYRLSAGSGGRYVGHVSGGGRLGGVRLVGGVAANGHPDFALPHSFDEERWEDGDVRDFSRREQFLAWGRGSWDVSRDLVASVSTQVADASRDVPASTIANRPRFWRFPYWREVRTVGALGWRPSDAVVVEGRVFYGTNDNELASYTDFDRTERVWLSSVANRAVGGYVFSEYRRVAGHRLSGGLNMRRDGASLQSDIGAPWRHYDASTVSLFGQDVVSIGGSDRLALAVNHDVMFGEDRYLASWNPQVGWSHSFRGDVSLRVLVGAKTRFPTLKEWFSPEIGNKGLRPEKSGSAEIEVVRPLSSGSRLSLLAYRQRVEDMITTAGWGHPAENLAVVDSWGAELGAAQKLSQQLAVDATLAMTSARVSETGDLVPLVPRTSCGLSATYRRGPGALLARVVRVGSRRGLAGGTLAPYVLVDARVSVETRWGEFFAGVDNLLDVLYEDEEGFPQPGFSFEVGISRSLYR